MDLPAIGSWFFSRGRVLCGALLLACVIAPAGAWAAAPNVLLILADDLGYGDVRCFNPEGKIATPEMDRLAAEGMRFTDAHSASSVCSPSRYALLTGRYPWRNGRLSAGVIDEFEDAIMAPSRLTLASFLRRYGYQTSCVGKWHLGWNWKIPLEQSHLFAGLDTGKGLEPSAEQKAAWREVFSKPILGGPLDYGFDSYFGVDIPNWPPFCFIENDRTVGIPSTYLPAAQMAPRMADRLGPSVEGWDLEKLLPALIDRACALIDEASKSEAPFFLYLSLNSPHTPLAIAPEWKGKTGINDYADFVAQTDAEVGRVLRALEKSGKAGETMVILTSDNGCADYIGLDQLRAHGHQPNGPWRGYKREIWEGGHRIPLIVRWPGVVKAGTSCADLVDQADLFATLAEHLGVKTPATTAEDSFSFLAALKGEGRGTRRASVYQDFNGLKAIRDGEWKMVFGPGGGGALEQLFNLAVDPKESKNVIEENPLVASKMRAEMKRIVDNGATAPGRVGKNDRPVKWNKYGK